MSKEILINQLFAGAYLNEGENIGHEVINLFKDDEGNNNLFITPNGRVTNHDLECIIFVRNTSARRTVEVIGVAKKLRSVTTEEIKLIRYAGVSLEQVFKGNRYHNESDDFADHVTFRSGQVVLPLNRIFLTVDTEYESKDCVIKLESKRKVIIPQGMREYYSVQEDPIAYGQLKKMIEDSRYWSESDVTEKIMSKGSIQANSPTFLEVIRKEDDENIFSNLFAYFFEYSHDAFRRFAKDENLLSISDMSLNFEICRETKHRVDLWIESDKDVIVIENKIKSGINGVVNEDYSQLNKYHDLAKEYAKKNDKNAHFYIFAPDYAHFDIRKFKMQDDYKIIPYSFIYNFFIREAATYMADRLFPDFIRGLERHTRTLSELHFDTMRSRFLERIEQLNIT